MKTDSTQYRRSGGAGQGTRLMPGRQGPPPAGLGAGRTGAPVTGVPSRLAHEQVLDALADGVIVAGRDGLVGYMNRAAEALTGWEAACAVGRTVDEVFPARTIPTGLDDRLGAPHIEAARRVLLTRRDGSTVGIRESRSTVLDARGKALATTICFHDATPDHALTDELAHRASHDGLTGLPNRWELERRLERTLERARRFGEASALCYMDLDRFKRVNDEAGHAAGDTLLCRIAVVLAAGLRQRDTLARMSGDELAVLLEHCPLPQAAHITRKLCRAVRELDFDWDGRRFAVSLSAGVAPIRDDGGGIESVLAMADAACYEAKRRGGDAAVVASTAAAQTPRGRRRA